MALSPFYHVADVSYKSTFPVSAPVALCINHWNFLVPNATEWVMNRPYPYIYKLYRCVKLPTANCTSPSAPSPYPCPGPSIVIFVAFLLLLEVLLLLILEELLFKVSLFLEFCCLYCSFCWCFVRFRVVGEVLRSLNLSHSLSDNSCTPAEFSATGPKATVSTGHRSSMDISVHKICV